MRVRRQESADLLRKIEEDGARLEDRQRFTPGAVAIDDGRDLAVGADGQEIGSVLLVLAEVDRVECRRRSLEAPCGIQHLFFVSRSRSFEPRERETKKRYNQTRTA